jgi:hypothetical protein
MLGVLRVGDKTGIADCSARDANGHPAAAPPSSVMNSRRFMSDMGFLPHRPTSRHRRTRRRPTQPVCRNTQPNTSDRHVLGADLNRSESPVPHSPPHENLAKARPAKTTARPIFHHECKLEFEGIVANRKKRPSLRATTNWLGRRKNQACAAVKRAAEEEWGHAHAGLLSKLATPPRQHRAQR